MRAENLREVALAALRDPNNPVTRNLLASRSAEEYARLIRDLEDGGDANEEAITILAQVGRIRILILDLRGPDYTREIAPTEGEADRLAIRIVLFHFLLTFLKHVRSGSRPQPGCSALFRPHRFRPTGRAAAGCARRGGARGGPRPGGRGEREQAPCNSLSARRDSRRP